MKIFCLALSSVALILTAMSSTADDFNSAGVKIHMPFRGKVIR